jgi:hypothetical protein
MPFISYAQNNEDVLLWRALNHIQHGFYVDVGTRDPDRDSVTRAFYERKWHGINLTPGPSCYVLFCENRPGDINLSIAISETGSEKGDFQPKNGRIISNSKDNASILNQIFKEYVKEEVIHFLKFDVAGSEKEILSGLDLHQWRPWILMINVITPGANDLNDKNWETTISSSGYEMVYFDGLTRFYLAKDHADLRKNFQTPPNVLDDFISNHLKTTIDDLEKTQMKLMTIIAERNQLKTECEQLQSELTKVYNSRSYRITAPMRFVFGTGRIWREKIKNFSSTRINFIHKVFHLKTLPQLITHQFILSIMLYAEHHHGFYRVMRKIINRYPNLKLRIKKILYQNKLPNQLISESKSDYLRIPMNQEVQQIYQDLVNNLNREIDIEQ